MGRFYIEHFGGKRIFSCASCETFLTNKDMLMSTRFTGATGRAFLFTRVANLEYSEVQDRVMLTGRHMVRDVACMVCKTKLGWFYEFATDEGQRYKEGKVILERALVQVCKTKLGWFYEFATDEGQRYKEGKVILERALVQESEGFSTERVSDDPEPSPPQADPRERERELVRDLQPNNMIRLLADAHLGNRYDDLPIPILPRHPNQP